MKTTGKAILPETIEAVILDLEGVVAQTALLHARAWQTMFDTFFKGRQNGHAFAALNTQKEYLRCLDGKPCTERMRRFLASRHTQLPEGSPRDAPGTATLHGLVNLKNKLLLRLIEEEGVDVFADTVACIRQWRAEGKKIAVIAPGKHCASLIRRAALDPLFDVQVGGAAATRPGPAARPATDVLCEAARKMGVSPGRTMLIENARPGEQAGSRADFGLVVGVARHARAEELIGYRADVIVKSLAELELPRSRAGHSLAAAAPELPSAVEKVKAIGNEPPGSYLAFLLDYDGTLAPIAARPGEAHLSESIRELLRQLACRCTVVIVSGRDRADVEKRVGLPGLIYAGSHGFDISGPDGLRVQHPGADACLPDLCNAQKVLNHLLEDVEGIQLERKKYALAVHFPHVPEDKVAYVKDVVRWVSHAAERLTFTTGKTVLELRPALDWHKGKAVGWIMDALQLDLTKAVPIYMGDDSTDEEAFRFLGDTGVGILVGGHGGPTEAAYRLQDMGEVEELLLIAVQFLKKPAS